MSEIVQETNVGEFRGNYPDVPNAAGVNMEELRALDPDPFFVTLPLVPLAGTVSKNGTLYDDALMASVEEQINSARPGGINGHIANQDRENAYPLPVGLWVGAKRIGETLWGKAYLPPSDFRNHVRQLKAVGGKIATSIYGRGDYEPVRTGVRRLKNFQLESMDFAPPSRAALGNGTLPHITREMSSQEAEMDKQQIIAELTVADIPAPLREQIVAELRQQVTDRDALVAELQTTVAEYQRQRFDADLDTRIAELTAWNVTGDANVAKVAAFRRTLKSRIVAELGEDRDADKVAETVTAMWTDLQPLAETLRDALAGPPAAVGAKPAGRQAWKDELVSKAGELRAQYGI